MSNLINSCVILRLFLPFSRVCQLEFHQRLRGENTAEILEGEPSRDESRKRVIRYTPVKGESDALGLYGKK